MPRKPARRATRKASTARPPSLLIVQFDTDKLRVDGLDFGGAARLVAALAAFGLGASVRVIEGTTDSDLRAQLSALVAGGERFDLVTCIGHGNEGGMRVAPDRPLAGWEEFGGYLRKLEPRRLLLVTCRGGVSPAANVLFRRLSKLRRIFATPVTASKQLAQLMVAAIPYMLAVKRPPQDVVFKAQAVAVAVTGRQLREWQRNADKDNPAGFLWDIAAKALDKPAQDLAAALRSWLK